MLIARGVTSKVPAVAFMGCLYIAVNGKVPVFQFAACSSGTVILFLQRARKVTILDICNCEKNQVDHALLDCMDRAVLVSSCSGTRLVRNMLYHYPLKLWLASLTLLNYVRMISQLLHYLSH